MDPSQQRFQKVRAESADESGQAGSFLAGGIVLVVVGVILILQAHAGVADFGGGMLVLMGGALVAAAVWLYGRRPQDP